MVIFHWKNDSLTSGELIDLHFIESDSVDIDLTGEEIVETACFDSLANSIGCECKRDRDIPLGKLVL